MPNTQQVESFLSSYPEEVRETVRAAREFLAARLPKAQESIDESAKLFGFSYGPGYKGLVCTLIMSRSGVKLGIVRGAELADPNRLLTGTGKVHRHVQLHNAADLQRAGMNDLLRQVLEAWRERNAAHGDKARVVRRATRAKR